MAAKVAMVAVPTVLGIASIRVYSLSETPTNFQSTREQLNVYTPLPWSTPARGVAQEPGVIENGVTSVRHGVLPLVHAVKGACVSVKKGGINLYHSGQDVYYYLKDPPPGFLPRFGTITMAGLLGMFVARRGSRLKRFVVPLGLMTAGATVCYPAQAVAGFKVTGKTAYAAGRWSSSTVSSLFSSQAPAATDTAAALVQVNNLLPSERQASEVPSSAAAEETQPAACHASEPSVSSEESTQSAEISKTEAAESLPVSPELAIPAAEEASAVESPDHSPTEALSATAETTSPSEDVTVESRSLSEDVSAAVSPDELALNLDPETGEVAPAQEALQVLQQQEAAVLPEPESEVESPATPAEETPASAPPAEQPGADNSKDGAGFKPDPALMDFGQSNPEDEDLYSTRS